MVRRDEVKEDKEEGRGEERKGSRLAGKPL